MLTISQLKRIRFGIFETISAIITPFLDQGSTLKPEKIQWFPNAVKTDLTIKKPHHRAISKAKSMRRVKSHQNHYMKKVSIFWYSDWHKDLIFERFSIIKYLFDTRQKLFSRKQNLIRIRFLSESFLFNLISLFEK